MLLGRVLCDDVAQTKLYVYTMPCFSQALKDRVISTSNYVKTLFKHLEERLLPSKAEKTRAVKEFQSYPSPHRQTSKRAKKGKRQSDKRSKTVDVNIPTVP